MQDRKFIEVNFSSRLAQARTKKGLTKKELAAKSGLPASSLSYYEDGRLPGGYELFALSKALGVSVDWLLDGEQSPAENETWRDRALAAESKIEVLKSGLSGLLKKI